MTQLNRHPRNESRAADTKARSIPVAANRIGFMDGTDHCEVAHCYGPATDGSCPRCELGDVVPCAGYDLHRTASEGTDTYTVGPQMTICPVTLAGAVNSDSTLLP